jgi:hypothetical protein
VGLHPRLLEQPPVGGELPVGRVARGGEREVVLDGPALGVLGVQRLVQRDAEAAQDRARLECSGGDLLALGTRARLRGDPRPRPALLFAQYASVSTTEAQTLAWDD